MSTKYLNIDEIAPEKKVLTLKGKEHVMHQVSVKEFVEISKAAQEADEADFKDLPVYDQITRLVDQIMKAFPTVIRDDLESLMLDQLVAIIKFTSGNLEEEKEVKEEAGKKKGQK